ncbi:hypothetical protein D9758_017212 [Tetrapyrgos nigripes]|uniref:Reverse transcriptase domain-containing protein n=1 Tax=Tetrapyrgos nigripes TaxID=182062 RepID=A0A8H5FDV8_9AGAR|nr:hypothetical protein D9758_017212 [Tetrapyrgos nigripes]
MEYVVESNGECSMSFKAHMGVLMGDPVSPTLWLLYMHDFALKEHPDDISLMATVISHLEHADDVVLISSSCHGLQFHLDTFAKWCSENALVVNRLKSWAMVFGPLIGLLPILTLTGEIVQYTKQHTYVGITFCSTERNIFAAHFSHIATEAQKNANAVLSIESVLVDVQKIYLQWVLGINNHSILAPLFMELAILPLQYCQIILTLHYLQYILLRDPSHYAHIALQSCLSLFHQMKSNWLGNLANILITLTSLSLPTDNSLTPELISINMSSNNTNNNSESIFNVPMLNTTNYEQWNYAITCLLEAKGLSRIAQGTQKCYVNTSPTETGNAPSYPEGFEQISDEAFNDLTESERLSYNHTIATFNDQWNQHQILVKKCDQEIVETYKLQSAWDDKDEQALGYISSFRPNDVGLGEFTQEEIDENHCAKAKGDYTLNMLWNKIDKKYSSPGPTSWFLDFKEFMSWTLDEKKDPANQIATLGAVLTCLKVYGFTVDDKFRALFLMDCILQSWGNYAQFTLATIEPKNLTMAHVEGLILVEYKQQTGQSSESSLLTRITGDRRKFDSAPNWNIQKAGSSKQKNQNKGKGKQPKPKEPSNNVTTGDVRPQTILGYFILTHYERLMVNELAQETVDFQSFLRVEACHQMTCKLAEVWDYTYNSDGTHTEPYLRAKEDLNGDEDMTNRWFDHEGTICPIQKQIEEEVEYFCRYIMNKALSEMHTHKWIPQQFKKCEPAPSKPPSLIERAYWSTPAQSVMCTNGVTINTQFHDTSLYLDFIRTLPIHHTKVSSSSSSRKRKAVQGSSSSESSDSTSLDHSEESSFNYTPPSVAFKMWQDRMSHMFTDPILENMKREPDESANTSKKPCYDAPLEEEAGPSSLANAINVSILSGYLADDDGVSLGSESDVEIYIDGDETMAFWQTIVNLIQP